ncbi:hypothetical protein HHI36_007977 [Cryptolaemus montrouzieri]|uniref:Uncharacterized protein n=1 Tax=Cryptolaemus montrouzieri TaxID=559131 RepID=A0ABD2MRA5_9CUCU
MNRNNQTDLFLCGDTNINLLNKRLGQVRTLLNLLAEFNLTPIVEEPTRNTVEFGTWIDNIFVSKEIDMYCAAEVMGTFLSDHTYQIVNIDYLTVSEESAIQGNQTESKRIFKTENIEQFKAQIGAVK